MTDVENPKCVFCKSSKVIKHGMTNTGNRRYRCRHCGRTWVLEKVETVRPDLADLAEAYLNGRTCRDLVSVYKSSPLRINQRIREFLEGVPFWEEYLDSCVAKHEPRLIYLIGKYFSCSVKGSKNNTMYLAMAVDALSTVVLGYEIGPKESRGVWLSLLDRMNCRGVVAPTFMSNGSRHVEEAMQVVFPFATHRIFYHRAYRDKELACCLSRLPMNSKLINDALRAYDTSKNKNLLKYLKSNNDHRIKDFLVATPEYFIKRLNERMNNKPKTRIEGLTNSFQSRFEKFHMIKDDPYPVINGWISLWMLQRLDIGFSRLSVYLQVPCSTSFKKFSCGEKPIILNLDDDSPLLKTFVIEIASRSLQLPIFYARCEMKLDKCSLF